MKWLEILISLIRIRIKNRREFAVIRKTYRLARKVMRDQNNGLMWDESNNYSKVLIVFLVKNVHRLQSITLLCKRGLAKDAVPLLRGMFEEFIDLRYMSVNKTRVQDFIDYDIYQRYKIGRILINKKDEGIDKNRVTTRNEALKCEWEKIKHRFTYKTKNRKEKVYKRWTRGDVRQICNEIGLGDMYDYLFSYLSIYIHSNPITINDFVLGRKGNNIVLEIGASPTLVPEVLATSSGIYLDMLRIADKDFEMGLDKMIKPVEDILKNAGEARKKQRKSVSKNTNI